MRARTRSIRMVGALAATAVGVLAASPAAHAEPRGHIREEAPVGFVYSTFEDGPNLMMLVGGDADAFCDDNPLDPFNAEPGQAEYRTFVRKSGVVDVKVNDIDQPVVIYQLPAGAIPPLWLADVCDDGGPGPKPFAIGTASLKVRLSIISDDLIDVFNSVNGKVVASDGAEHKVRASADLVVENGEPVGDPADFVELELTEIRR